MSSTRPLADGRRGSPDFSDATPLRSEWLYCARNALDNTEATGKANMQLILADDHALFLDALEAYLNLLKPDIEIHKAINLDCTMRKVKSAPRTDLVML
ncbi:MAG: hypothetical protein MI740_19005, partial [Halanaerobiales bacterium]|nr:hypothetical protein [Halanaerobiales bacterium]